MQLSMTRMRFDDLEAVF